jgi:hypothetical protein
MNLNSTLILQGIHFGIVYLVLKKFLFKPVIDAVRIEERHLHDLQKSIEHRQAMLRIAQHAMENAWKESQMQRAQSMPDVQESVHIPSAPELKLPLIPEQTLHTLIADSAHALAKKVEHVK